jgi:PleD family two-component response regulator
MGRTKPAGSRSRVLSVTARSVRPLAGVRPRAGPRRVLVVDDAEGIRSYLANFLELRGFLVDTAKTAVRAQLLEAGARQTWCCWTS